jgi:predicted O-methyltransferase YrrM
VVDEAGFEFTSDWFSPNLQNFEAILSIYKGKPVRFLEIGSFEGRSTVWFLREILTHQNAQITCIDIAFRPLFFRNIRKVLAPRPWWRPSPHVKPMCGPSFDLLRVLPSNYFDFIYVDGSHSDMAVLQDAVLSFPLLKEGGIIAFDDYLWDNPPFNQFGTPKVAIDAFMQVYAHRIETLTLNYQAWFRKVKDDRSDGGTARTGASP